MKKALYIFVQCTWGILQTLVGFVVFLCNIKKPHALYHGSVLTEWSNHASISLGMFVFVYNGGASRSELRPSAKRIFADEGLIVHEYGHTIQSLLLGPLYLVVIGIPSLLWAELPRYIKKRKEGAPYSAFWTERGADRLGERTTRERSFTNTES
ncbi:MAG: hypothetical protein IKS90_01965 [Clostridia bacterium]|nr:hypothetical protein [Clostridia bacterium]